MKKKIYFCMLFFCFYLIVPAFATDWPSGQLSTRSGWGHETAGLGMCKCQLDNDPKIDVVFAWIDDPKGDNSIYYRIILNEKQLIKPADAKVTKTGGWMNSGLGIASSDIDKNGEPDVAFVWVDNPGDVGKIDGNAFHPDEPIGGDNCIYYMIAYNLHKEGGQYKFRSKSKVFKKSENPNIGWRTQGLGAVLVNIDSDNRFELLVAYIDAPSGTNHVHFKALMNINYNTSRGNYWVNCDKKIAIGSHNQGLGMDIISQYHKNVDLALTAVDNPSEENKLWQTLVRGMYKGNHLTFENAETYKNKTEFGHHNQGAALVKYNTRQEYPPKHHSTSVSQDAYVHSLFHLIVDNPNGANRIDSYTQNHFPPYKIIDRGRFCGFFASYCKMGDNLPVAQSFKAKLPLLTNVEVGIRSDGWHASPPMSFNIKLKSGSINGSTIAEGTVSGGFGRNEHYVSKWLGISLNPPIQVNPVETYYIVIDRSTRSYRWLYGGNSFPDGESYWEGSLVRDKDFEFRTLGYYDYPY